ncbi:hypothetical protein [Streptomyces sp. NPDC020480]|uniref:hypothetical protein n=1 Tax=Streptomyces sp. NPDC020480 TaxID=3365076 RepID=UPI0037AC72C0
MNRTIRLLSPLMLATALVTAGPLAGTGTAAPAQEATLDLYSQPNGGGEQLSINVDPGCASLDASFTTRSTSNFSDYGAALYSNDDCAGRPFRTLPPGTSTNLLRPHDVASVNFVE